MINVSKQLRSAQNWQSQRKRRPKSWESCSLHVLVPHPPQNEGHCSIPIRSSMGFLTRRNKRATTSVGRPLNVTVCRLPRFTPFIPKGKVHSRLKEQGRIQNVQLTRSVTPVSVREAITRTYQGIHQWVYLETGQDNRLQEAKLQSLDGNTACSRRGCLYILDKEVRCLSLCV